MSERKLSGIEMFAFDVVMEPRESGPRGTVRRYGLLKLSCGENAGYGVCPISEGFAPADLVRWSSCLSRLRGLTPREAAAAIEADRWGSRERHPAQYALVGQALSDLRAARQPRPAGTILPHGLEAAGLPRGLAAQASAHRPEARSGAAAVAIAERIEAPALSAGADLSGAVQPDDALQLLRAAAIGRPSSYALMDRADAYCSLF